MAVKNLTDCAKVEGLAMGAQYTVTVLVRTTFGDSLPSPALLVCIPYDMLMFKVRVIGGENEDHAMIAEKNVMPVTQMRIDSNLRVFR